MPRTIAFPINDSDISKNSIRWSLKRFLLPDDHILLVTHNDKPTSNSASNLVSHFQTSFFSNFQVTSKVVVGGDAKSALKDAINDHNPDLCIIGSRGNSGLKKIASGGSFSEYFLKHLVCPILVSKHDLNFESMKTQPSKVCFPVDGSKESKLALKWTKDTFLNPTDQLCMVTVLKQKQENEENLVKEYSAELPNAPLDIIYGHVNESLLKYLNETKPDLCVIGTRNLQGIKKLMLGSTAEYILNNIEDVAVLVIK